MARTRTSRLRNLAIDLRPVYIINTNEAAEYPLQLFYRYGLEKLLDAIEIPYASLHAAGNDALFCLQALLVLPVKDAEKGGAANEELLRMLKGLVWAPPPVTLGEIQDSCASARREAKAAVKAGRKARRAARRE